MVSDIDVFVEVVVVTNVVVIVFDDVVTYDVVDVVMNVVVRCHSMSHR